MLHIVLECLLDVAKGEFRLPFVFLLTHGEDLGRHLSVVGGEEVEVAGGIHSFVVGLVFGGRLPYFGFGDVRIAGHVSFIAERFGVDGGVDVEDVYPFPDVLRGKFEPIFFLGIINFHVISVFLTQK